MIALEEGGRTGEPEALFSPPVSTAIVVGGASVALLLCLSDRWSRTVLLTPVDGRLQAVLVSVGVFAGVWVAAVAREMWTLGISLDGVVPEEFVRAFNLLLMVAVGAWCGVIVAGQATEWRAFHGLRASAAPERFIVADLTSSRRSRWLHLVGASGAPAISVNCLAQGCAGLGAGDLLLVRVETGRGGVRRAVFPAEVEAHAARR